MYLHDSILWALGTSGLSNGASGINIFCETSKRKEVAQFFEDTFEKFWNDAQNAVEKEYGDCYEKDEGYGAPVSVFVTDDGVSAEFGTLDLTYQDGEYLESKGFGHKALNKSLKKLLKKYPEVSYEGYIGYYWSDCKCSDVTQYEISSERDFRGKSDKVYDFVGNALAYAMTEGEDEFWDEMYEQLCDCEIEDFEQVLACFHAYSKWLPKNAYNRLMELADEVDEEIGSELEELLECGEYGEETEISKNKVDTSNLPDGYMDALMATINAEYEKEDAEMEEI